MTTLEKAESWTGFANQKWQVQKIPMQYIETHILIAGYKRVFLS